MVHSPGRKPLHLLTDDELKTMAMSAGKNVLYSANNISEEMRYRERHRNSQRVAMLTGAALVINVLTVIANVSSRSSSSTSHNT